MPSRFYCSQCGRHPSMVIRAAIPADVERTDSRPGFFRPSQIPVNSGFTAELEIVRRRLAGMLGKESGNAYRCLLCYRSERVFGEAMPGARDHLKPAVIAYGLQLLQQCLGLGDRHLMVSIAVHE